MYNLETVGTDWLVDVVEGFTDHIDHMTPVEFNEANRYLPKSVTSISGPISYDVNPFMREIINCADVNSPVREVSLKKGVQITFSTLLESIAFYFMAHVKTDPMMYITADKELALARIENNFIPMLNHSGFADIIRSSDLGNTRKTGKTKDHLQFAGGAYLVPFGAKNADKMRAYSMLLLLKDEIDAWPVTVGKDGDPDKLTDSRCKGYWQRRKIFRGSTPTIKGVSKIDDAYLRGDQRKYMVLCKKCRYPQELRWSMPNGVGGFKWDLDDGILILESVRYDCQKCGESHFEHDKERLFSEKHGAHWKPTARPKEPGMRSYHLPAMYSPIGMAPWYSLVADYIECYDVESKKVIDIGKYQVFYNNVLAEPFEIPGSRIRFTQVSAHRRAVYRLGQVPNKYAAQWSGSPVLMVTCQVDVHKSNLAVTVFGWCKGAISYVIDYWRFETKSGEDDCSELTSPVWQQLRELIEEKQYTADDGKKYNIIGTFIDAGYANDTVTTFCSEYESGVYPIIGRERPAKNQKIAEFAQFETQAGVVGYRILVDHYKDRLAPVLRREWIEETGPQKTYHFNAPVDVTDKQLKELTAETRRKQEDPNGRVSYVWYRPSGRANELWDLTVYGHAGVEILAWMICIDHLKMEKIDWVEFWNFLEEKSFYFTDE